MNNIKDCVTEVIKAWNDQVKNAYTKTQDPKLNIQFVLDVNIRKKKSYINRKDYFENKIAEIVLYHKGNDKEPDLLLWRNQKIMPPKVKCVPVHQVESDYINSLYKQFLYEAIGNFCVTTKQLILSQDWAEYDIANDRLKQHESATDMIIQTLEDGEFYKKGDEFDVFMRLDEHYAVYTQHDIGKANNGIARIPIKKCMVTQNAKVKIILDY